MKTPTQLMLYARFARYLLWEFRWSISVFWSLVLVVGLILQVGYRHRDIGYLEACYAVFMLVFVQPPNLDFPDEWYLQLLFFVVPIVGLGAVADSVVRLAFLVFSQKRRLPEWQNMVASVYRNHMVVVGAGKMGIRIIKGLLALREPVVAIERLENSPFLDEVHDMGVPVITGDGRQKKTLEKAGVKDARAIICASDDDLTNLDAALTARDINPNIRVVLRLFDDTLAEKFASVFQMPAISPSRVAAPAFIAAATDRKVYTELQLDGQQVHLIDLTVRAGSALVGRTVGQIQHDKIVNIVMHRGPAGVNVNPGHDVVLNPNDTVLVIAPMDRLLLMEAENQATASFVASTSL